MSDDFLQGQVKKEVLFNGIDMSGVVFNMMGIEFLLRMENEEWKKVIYGIRQEMELCHSDLIIHIQPNDPGSPPMCTWNYTFGKSRPKVERSGCSSPRPR
jgi:hypothetical protein